MIRLDVVVCVERDVLDLILAAVAGLISFLSPCVLPLVPAYIGYMGGRMTHTVATTMPQTGGASGGSAALAVDRSLAMRFNTALHGAAFVLGFTFVFVTLGILGTAFVRQIGSTATVETMIGRIGGVVIIVLGLHFMGALPVLFRHLRARPQVIGSPLWTALVALALSAVIAWAFTGTVALWNTAAYPAWTGAIALVLLAIVWLGMVLGGGFSQPTAFWTRAMNTIDYALYADTRRQMTPSANRGLANSALIGVVFAAGWTPCIGPTLGAAMMMAANTGEIGQAALLMTVYSLGMGVPFILTALLLDGAQGGLRRLNRHMNWIKLASGGFLVLMGFAIASGQLAELSRDFSVQFGDFSYRMEQCTVGLFDGDISLGQYGTCIGGGESYNALREAHSGAEAFGDIAGPSLWLGPLQAVTPPDTL